MSCEKYKEALIEAAVDGDTLAPTVRTHVEACAECAAELAQQRSLIAAIDTNMHRQMNAPVPAAMLQRFEARIAQQASPRLPKLRWVYATAAFATAVALILFALPRARQNKTNAGSAGLTQTAPPIADHRPQITLVLQPTAPEEIRRAKAPHSRLSTRPEPEVLVPPDERIAFEHLIASLNDRERLAAAISKPIQEQPEQRVVSLTTPDIETAAIVVQPIQDSADR